MAFPTGTLSYPDAGWMRVYLSARYVRQNADVGFPNAADGNVRIKAYIGPPGSYTRTSVIDKYTLSTFIDLLYPGGNVVWNLGVELHELQYAAGLVFVGMRDIRLAW